MKNFSYYVLILSVILFCFFLAPVCTASAVTGTGDDGYSTDENIRVVVRFEEVPLVTPPDRPSDTPWSVSEEYLFYSTVVEGETVKGVRGSIFSLSRTTGGYGLTPAKDGGRIAYLLTPANDAYVSSYGSDLALWMGKFDSGNEIEWLKRFAVVITTEEILPATPVPVVPEPVVTPEETPEPVAAIVSMPSAIAAGYGWPVCYGGSEDETGYMVVNAAEGGFALVGPTGSIDGDVSGNHGMLDFWLLRLGDDMLPEWKKTLGGSREDIGTALVSDPDGGFTVTGLTRSDDGDVSGRHGKQDLWVAQTDADGTLLWQRCFGGSDDDGGTDIIRTPDGGYIVTGWTRSSDGDIVGPKGGMDAWIISLGPDHGIRWQVILGGEGEDILRQIIPANDGGYIAVGGSNSAMTMTSSDSQTPFTDYWIVKISEYGIPEWSTYWGGLSNDEAFGIASTGPEGYLITGYAQSSDGFVDDNHGGKDVWLLGIDNTGMITSKRSYGGSSDDSGLAIVFDDLSGTATVTGRTSSDDGDVSGNHGGEDLWIFSVDMTGNLLWQRCMGGRADDSGESIVPIEGGYLVVGSTASHNGDVTGNHGKVDVWVAKVGNDGSALTPATGLGMLFDKYSFIILLLVIVLFLLIGIVCENEWRRKRPAIKPGEDAEIMRIALDLLDDLRFEIRRLTVKGVMMPEEITDLEPLEEMLRKRDYHGVISEARRRIGVLHGIEDAFDTADSEITLMDGETVRLQGRGVIFEDMGPAVKSIFREGRYNDAYQAALNAIKEMRAKESDYNSAMEIYRLVKEESARLAEKGIIFVERTGELFEKISSGDYQAAVVTGNGIAADLKSIESRFDHASGAIELMRSETLRLKEKGVSIVDRSAEAEDLFESGDYDSAAGRADEIVEEIRSREAEYESAQEALAALKNEIERLKQRDSAEDAESGESNLGGDEK